MRCRRGPNWPGRPRSLRLSLQHVPDRPLMDSAVARDPDAVRPWREPHWSANIFRCPIEGPTRQSGSYRVDRGPPCRTLRTECPRGGDPTRTHHGGSTALFRMEGPRPPAFIAPGRSRAIPNHRIYIRHRDEPAMRSRVPPWHCARRVGRSIGVALVVALSVSVIAAGGFIPSADLGRRKVESPLGGGRQSGGG